MDTAALKNEIATIRCEHATIEFKSHADFADKRCELQLIRSIVAMHNSGGGTIVFGLDSHGEPLGIDIAATRAIDPIVLSDKVRAFTGRPLAGIIRDEFERGGCSFPGWIIPGAAVPVPFAKDGDLHVGQGKPEKLFHKGQIYVRRGASSVPADAGDMELCAEKIRSSARQVFAAEIGRFAVVPPGHTIQVLAPGSVVTGSAPEQRVRVTDDPDAPGAVIVDRFRTHPHRQKELVQRLATRLPGHRVNGHDIACIRKVYATEIESKGFLYLPPHSSRHYSEGFADWIVGRIEADPNFLDKTRQRCKLATAA
ncbi:MAG: RNA-binding domain-containing protein [Phycisphaerales bacterium]